MGCSSNGPLKTVSQAKADLLDCAGSMSKNSRTTAHPGVAMAASFGAGLATARRIRRKKEGNAPRPRHAFSQELAFSFILLFANKIAQTMLDGILALRASRRKTTAVVDPTSEQAAEGFNVDNQC
jgi:hypothetical protein